MVKMLTKRYVPKIISEIIESDSKISIIGKIISVYENGFKIEDKSGKIDISSTYPINNNSLVRVFCTFNSKTLKADIVQPLNGLDVNFYHKVEELYRKVRI